MTALPISFVNRQRRLRVPRQRIAHAVREAYRVSGQRRWPPLSIVLVDDAEMRRLHREFLGEDATTDVMSFPLSPLEQAVETGEEFGEVVASAQTAVRCADELGHPPTFELTLYVIHGVLHLLGYGDSSPQQRRRMRRAERMCLQAAGIDENLFPVVP